MDTSAIIHFLKELNTRYLIERDIFIEGDQLIIQGCIFSVEHYRRIHLLGLGKASVEQVGSLKRIVKKSSLQNKLGMTLAVAKAGLIDPSMVAELDVLISDHPVPTSRSFLATEKVIERLTKEVSTDDLLIVCISGGASSLFSMPIDDFSHGEKIQLHQELVASGASINQMNQLRQALSSVKNGGLHQFHRTDDVINLMLSDVPTKELNRIGSGPTLYRFLDDRTIVDYAECYLKSEELKKRIRDIVLSSQWKDAQDRKLKANQEKKQTHFVLADFYRLIKLAKQAFQSGEEKVFSIDEPIDMSIDEALAMHLDWMRNIIPQSKKAVLVSGGEATVDVKKGGKGGRNTHFVLEMAKAIFFERTLNCSQERLEQLEIISVGTDGNDGPTDAAGAYYDFDLHQRVLAEKLDPQDYLTRCDSYHFFEKVDGLIKSGPTGNNLMDLRMIKF